MEPVADGVLCDLAKEGVREAEEMFLQRAAAVKLLEKIVGRHPQRRAAVLHHRVVDLRLGLHDHVETDHPFVSDQSQLDRSLFA